jgi:hypothetical protein
MIACIVPTGRIDVNSNLGHTTESRTGTLARLSAAIVGFAALAWFLVRVIPKPSRATYLCQRAAFPVVSAFVLWLCGSVAGIFSLAACASWCAATGGPRSASAL